MKRIFYFSLLFIIPFLASANHGRSQLNGKWISPFHGNVIKVKVKRNQIRIKNLTQRGWTTFLPTRRNRFEDCEVNNIRIKNIHELSFRSNCGSQRIRFVKKGHQHHNHICNQRCEIGNGYFQFESEYDNYSGYDGYSENLDTYGDQWALRSDQRSNGSMAGQYYVREIDGYVTIEPTPLGLRARRENRNWVNYRQNKYRKNEYIDSKGNKYNFRLDGTVRWRNKNGSTSLNLSKKN